MKNSVCTNCGHIGCDCEEKFKSQSNDTQGELRPTPNQTARELVRLLKEFSIYQQKNQNDPNDPVTFTLYDFFYWLQEQV